MNDADLFERARRVTPGGVHSPVRAFGQVGGSPVFVRSASGAELEATDGRRYLDFCMAFGPLILGHRPKTVSEALHAALDRGWSFGTAETVSLELSELITGQLPHVEQIRFVNSGTEAVMTALRIARAATGRDEILKFDGCYHGHADGLLIRGGSGLAGQSQPDSTGVPKAIGALTRVAPLDDEAMLRDVFGAHGEKLAAVIIEPLPANYGLLPQRKEFLKLVSSLARAAGCLVVLDEVITGFRLGFGGMAQKYKLDADLVTWGKIIGGGLPVGAVAGRRDLMEMLAPTGDAYQAGTLSANPLAMTGGHATLNSLENGDVYAELERLGQYLEAGVTEIGNLQIIREGSLFWLLTGHSDSMPIRRPDRIPSGHAKTYPALFHGLLEQCIYLPPSPVEACFLSAAHTKAHIDQLLEGLRRTIP